MKKIALMFLGGLILLGGNCSKNPVKDGHIIPPPPEWNELNRYPSWSPDGTTIAYFHETDRPLDTNDSSGLYLINVDGSNNRLIFRGWDFSGRATWSPDGKHLVFEYGYDILKLELSSGTVTALVTEGENVLPDWSPDTGSIVYQDNLLPLGGFIVIDTVGVPQCTVLDKSSSLYSPSWSSNSKRIVYGKYVRLNGSIQTEIFVMDKCGGNVERLTFTFEKTANRHPDWSIATDEIAWQYYYDVWVMNGDGSNKKQLTFGEGGDWPNWSPDGQWIAYQAWSNDNPDNPGNITILIMDRWGENKRRLFSSKM